ISGAWLTSEIVDEATFAAPDLIGKAVNLGFLVLGADLQPISPMAWAWDGTADSISIDRNGSADPVTRTISLSAGSVMTGRRRPKSAFYTDQDQQARSPGDRFCERASLMAIGTTKVWPE